MSKNVTVVGYNAGLSGGDNRVAIGAFASNPTGSLGSICVNASGVALAAMTGGCYINPIRNDNTVTSNSVNYNTITKELIYNTNSGSFGRELITIFPVAVSASTTMASFVFPGSVVASITSVRVVVDNQNVTTVGTITLNDITNVTTIAQTTFTGAPAATQRIVNLGTISNLPAGEAVFSVVLERTAGGGNVTFYSMALTIG